MARRRWTEKRKTELLEKFASCGLNAAAFCRKHRLPYHSFLDWRREALSAAEQRDEAPKFAEIEIETTEAGPASPAGTGPSVELILGGGMVLRIYRAEAQRR